MILSVFQGRFFMMRMLLLAAAAGLVTIGIIAIYAVGHPVQEYKDTGTQELKNTEPQGSSLNKYSNKWKKQLAFVGAGLMCLVGVNLFHYQRLGRISYAMYAVVLVLLALLLMDRIVDLPFVHERFGIRRWTQRKETRSPAGSPRPREAA